MIALKIYLAFTLFLGGCLLIAGVFTIQIDKYHANKLRRWHRRHREDRGDKTIYDILEMDKLGQ